MLESKLTPEERDRSEEFYRRSAPSDADQVRRVIRCVDSVAENYFSSGEIMENCWDFREGSPFIGIKREGTPFFAVYLVGGCLNKKGDRPDIDLLVATNMRWSRGFWGDPSQRETDPIWLALDDEFVTGYTVQKEGELPNDYNIGATQGKVLFRITPPEGKKIDVNYVRSWREKGFIFIDEEQFYQLDVNKKGKPLRRLALYRATSRLETPAERRERLYRRQYRSQLF